MLLAHGSQSTTLCLKLKRLKPSDFNPHVVGFKLIDSRYYYQCVHADLQFYRAYLPQMKHFSGVSNQNAKDFTDFQGYKECTH